jgi:hypothetical protein
MLENKFKFENLKVNTKAIEFIAILYETSNAYPKKEQYSLTSQFTRASRINRIEYSRRIFLY